MRVNLLIIGLVIFLKSCQFLEPREKQAIDICKNSKIQFPENNVFYYFGFAAKGLSQDSKWIEFANSIAKDNPNSTYNWEAKETENSDVYLVSFTDETNWGHSWEVSIDQQIVKHINSSEYLSRKYGLSRLDTDESFKIEDVSEKTLKKEKKYDYSIGKNSIGIVYQIKGFLVNNTDKNLTKADISGNLSLIFDSKIVERKGKWDSGFKRKITKSTPWRPQEKLEFYIKTEGIEEIYLQYEPEYVIFTLSVSAEDPVGFTFDKSIREIDLKSEWEKIKDPDVKSSENSKPATPAQSLRTETANPQAPYKPTTSQAISTPRESRVEETTKKVPEEPKIDQRAIFGSEATSGKGSQSAINSAQGNSNTTSDRNVIKVEDFEKDSNLHAGFGLDLKGWEVSSIPNINDQVSTKNGRMVFQITLNDVGKIVQAIPLEYNVSYDVLEYYLQVVNQFTFKSLDRTGSDSSTGKITFNIKVD